jgi:predicted dehydrogenase
VTICDQDPENLETARHRFPHLRFVPDIEQLLEDRSVEAVIIATPVSTHHALALRCLAAGRHVFVEKPLAASAREAEELVRVAEFAGRTLMVGHTFEYSPPVVKVKEIISSGALGEIYYISAVRVNLGLHQKDISVVWDLAPHDLSMIFYWLGASPTAVSMMGGAFVRPGVPDVAFMNMRFASGTIAGLQVSWLSPSKLRQTTVVGAKKMLLYDDTNTIERVKVFDKGVEFRDPTTFGEYALSYRSGDIVSPHISTTEPLQIEMEHFLDCVRTGARPRTDGRNGLRVVRALEAIERSGKNQSRLVHLEGSESAVGDGVGVASRVFGPVPDFVAAKGDEA